MRLKHIMQTPNRRIEAQFRRKGFRLIAGADEAGRGALAGPLVAAAVILPPRIRISRVRDSKLLTEKQREELFALITAKALAWSVRSVSEKDIDRTGIQQANLRALTSAILALRTTPHLALVDGFQLDLPFPAKRITHGDRMVFSIACASIIAKVTRDRRMRELHAAYPAFSFHRHKGYGTVRHRREILRHGKSAVHRKSFRLKVSSRPRKILVY